MMALATRPQSIRTLALEILCRIEAEGAFADQLITAMVARHGLSNQARAFLRELAYGVLRWRNRLDWMLGRCARRPIEAIAPVVRNLLRLGAYQLCFMERIPPYAAVSETVKVAKLVGHGGIVAFVNAVLRALERQRGSLSLANTTEGLATYLTIFQSHPRWLVERWLAYYGAERAEAMCRADNITPPLSVRVNRLRTTRNQLLESLVAEECRVDACRFAPDGVVLRAHPPLDRLKSYLEGWFTVQDEAAMLCGYLLAPQPGEQVLDACAAPGGKATHLAELMGDIGQVVALDQSSNRLRLVEENCRRLGLRSVRCLVGDASQIDLDEAFDRALIDAPCSGLGVLRRHPDAKWRKGPELVAAMQTRQLAMLEHVSRFLKPGGTLLYMTCSTEPEENQEVVEAFLRCHPEYRLDPTAVFLPETARIFAHEEGWFQTWPGPEGVDGFFAARFKRVGEATHG